MTERARFDVVCKELVKGLGESLGLISKSPFFVEAQQTVKSVMKFEGPEKGLKFSVDVAWLCSLVPSQTVGSLLSEVFSDVVVAWEIDAGGSRKAIRASIANLATLNPRLGVEWLLIGGTQKAIGEYESRFRTAIYATRIATARIIVITDVIFSQLYFLVTNRHPEELYEAYLEKASKDSSLGNLLKAKWEKLLKETKTKTKLEKRERYFRQGIREKLLDKLD
jgi:hypothetical protein